jgi:hypothetical protein
LSHVERKSLKPSALDLAEIGTRLGGLENLLRVADLEERG